jgi:phosphoheptose isomerase
LAKLQRIARDGDALIGMSCSGDSRNVLMALACAPDHAVRITLSGFARTNLLTSGRVQADIGFWVPSHEYGPVQIAHLDQSTFLASKLASRIPYSLPSLFKLGPVFS